jgi:hypothetical protein
MTRSLLEIRLAFFYLCTEECPREEWECRWNIFNLHDCMSRIRLFEEMPGGSQDIPSFTAQAVELRERLHTNSFFASLPERDKKRLLHGGHAYLHSLENIAARAGVEVNTFRLLYKLLSSHVHGLPLSFYRMGEQERGRGVHSEVEEGYTQLCLSFAISLLAAVRDEMEHLFMGIKDA